MNEHVFIGGHPIYPGYIVKGGGKNAMVEAGINIMGPLYLQAIQKFIGDKDSLDYLFVTQSHYDHLGAVCHIKQNIPSVKFGAFERVAEILDRESIIENMNFLSRQLVPYFRGKIEDAEKDLPIRKVDLDLALKEGDRFDLGIGALEVYETPGHTKDHLSFHIPEMGLLFPGEALGNPAGDGSEVKVEFASSYDDYIRSIEKLMLLKPQTVAMSHLYYYTGDDALVFMDRSYRETIAYRALIESYLDRANGDPETAKELMVRIEYDEERKVRMERNAYIANVGAQIRAVAALGTPPCRPGNGPK